MIYVAAAVAIVDGKVLLASRPADKPPAGWEFPGGKVEAGETVAQAAVRELREELAWEVMALDVIYRKRHHGLVIDFIRVLPIKGSVPQACEAQEFKWVPLESEVPDGLLPGDLEFWHFLTGR